MTGQAATIAGKQCRTCRRGALDGGAYCAFGCGKTMEPADLPSQGSVYASTVDHVPTKTLPSPHQVGYVDLPNDVRVFGHFDTAEPVHPDTPVEVVYADPADDAEIPYVRYRFVLAEEAAR